MESLPNAISWWCGRVICYTRTGRAQPKYRSQRVRTGAKKQFVNSAAAFSATPAASCPCRRQNPTIPPCGIGHHRCHHDPALRDRSSFSQSSDSCECLIPPSARCDAPPPPAPASSCAPLALGFIVPVNRRFSFHTAAKITAQSLPLRPSLH